MNSGMSFFGWVFFGFIVGLLAKSAMPKRDPIGLIGTTVLGIFGALVAGELGVLLKWYRPDEGTGFLSATVGSFIALFGYWLIARRRQSLYERQVGSRAASSSGAHSGRAA